MALEVPARIQGILRHAATLVPPDAGAFLVGYDAAPLLAAFDRVVLVKEEEEEKKQEKDVYPVVCKGCETLSPPPPPPPTSSPLRSMALRSASAHERVTEMEKAKKKEVGKRMPLSARKVA